MLVERITGRTPSNLSFADHQPIDVGTTKRKAAIHEFEDMKFWTINDWQMISLNKNFIPTSELGAFGDHEYNSYQSKTKLVLNDNSLREIHGRKSVSQRLPNIQKSPIRFSEVGYEASRTQYFKSTEGPPSDDHKQKIRWLELKLRSEVPKFLEPGKLQHDFNVYASNIELVIARTSEYRLCSGLPAYKGVVYLYRSMCKFWMHRPRLDILSVTCHEDKNIIDIRWRITGRPYYSLVFSFLLPPRRLNRHYDFVSVLSVNGDGQIWRHLITKLRPVRSHLFSDLSRVRKGLEDSTVMGPLTSRHARCSSSDDMPDS